MKVLITRKIPEAAGEIFQKAGYKVSVYQKDSPIPKEELIKRGNDADAVISLLTDKIDAEVIDQLDRCRIIANYAVGFNNIDVEYAQKKNIIVTNTPDILTDATADIAMALILACARNIVEGDKFIREGKFEGWKPRLMLGKELRGKTIGIAGAGRIGTETAKRAKAFGMKIIYFNRSKKEVFEKETGAKKVTLNSLMKRSDVISLHLPLTKSTINLLDGNQLNLMKPDAILVNTSRGEIVDEKALINILKQKKIFAAGFDVYENEPKINKEFFKLKNAVLLPHLGSATFEARNKMAELAAKNVVNVLSGRKAISPVGSNYK